MRRLRIRGLVRVADQTRRALAGPVTSGQLEQLREHARDAIRTVDALAAKQGTRVEHLPAPTRNAYRYLAGINWDAVQQQPAGHQAPPAHSSIRYKGLSSFFGKVLHQVGVSDPKVDTRAIHDAIRRTARRLTEDLARDAIKLSQLTPESRAILAWLTYFKQQATFDRLLDAIRGARAALTAEIEHCKSFELPVVVHFRPMKALFRVRRLHDATLVQLPTPMICFGTDDFMCLAMAICGDKAARQPVLERTATEEYRAILSELDGPVGDERTVGAFYDLNAVFRRVSRSCLASAVAKPRLVWSRRITGCKFGHYDPLRDELMVSATLDASDVPAYVLDFVVYHELLHKKYGATWQNGRQAVHTEAFREDEQRFAEYEAADEALRQLAKRLSS